MNKEETCVCLTTSGPFTGCLSRCAVSQFDPFWFGQTCMGFKNSGFCTVHLPKRAWLSFFYISCAQSLFSYNYSKTWNIQCIGRHLCRWYQDLHTLLRLYPFGLSYVDHKFLTYLIACYQLCFLLHVLLCSCSMPFKIGSRVLNWVCFMRSSSDTCFSRGLRNFFLCQEVFLFSRSQVGLV